MVNNYFKTWTPAGDVCGVFPFNDRDVSDIARAYQDVVVCKSTADHEVYAKDRNGQRLVVHRWISAYKRPPHTGPWSSFPTVKP